MELKVALSIAGSDPSAGAGIQADLKSFFYLGVYGLTVVTCVTSQNTQELKKIHKVPVAVIEDQIDAVFEDFQINAVKTGMLYDAEIVKCVSKRLSRYHIEPVVDPVMVATSGGILSGEGYLSALKQYLLPKALLIAANVPEACALSGRKIRSIDEMKHSCEILYDLGPKYVLIKGGHLRCKNTVDVIFDGKKYYDFSLPRVIKKNVHGSGCTLSALITGLLACGEPPLSAIEKAKVITWGMINDGYSLGKGADLLNHFSETIPPRSLTDNNLFVTWMELQMAIQHLNTIIPPIFIPEVGMNFVYALDNAKTPSEVCAIDGRITKTRERVKLCGTLDFGVSKHVASIVLAAMSFDESIRSALNIRYTKEILNAIKKTDLTMSSFRRTDEPKKTVSTMEWGTKQAITTFGAVPDIIYDTGGIGKEPMIRILGKDPKDTLKKLQKIIEVYR